MKKNIIIISILIALISVVIIGIFAAAVGQTIATVKVTSVEFDHSDEETIVVDENTETKRVRLEEGTTTYQLKWTIYPKKDEEAGIEGATNTKVTFQSDNELVRVSEDGVVTFPSTLTQSLSVTITIKTNDGDHTDTITFFIKHVNSSVITD